MPPLAQREYCLRDLVGLAAQADGAAIGTVVALHDFGAGPVLEIDRGRRVEPLLLPFVDSSVPRVDIAGGTVTIVVPDIV